MELKALKQGYKSVYIFLPLGSIFNFNFNRKYSSPNCHSRSRHIDKHHRARFNQILSLLDALAVPIRSITPRPGRWLPIQISKRRFYDHISG